MTGWGILISLLEAVVDRAADHLDAGQIVDETSKKTFGAKRSALRRPQAEPAPRGQPSGADREHRRGGGLRFQDARKPRLHGRAVAFMQAMTDQMRDNKEMKENKVRIKTLQRDIVSLTDHATFLSGKISFLLDAAPGLPPSNRTASSRSSPSPPSSPAPTLVASHRWMNFKLMPELKWVLGYPFALVLMIISAILPFLYFKRKGWL